MDSLNHSGAIFRYHRNMINTYGHTHSKALGWMDNYSQAVRFEALASIADLSQSTVLDAGCGYGDLSAYLHQLYKDVTYCGIEQIPELLEEANRRYGTIPGTTFISRNFMIDKLSVADYVLASGSLNYSSDDPDFIYRAIYKLYQNCKLGLGFNLLSYIAEIGFIVAYDPQLILAYCHTICANVRLLDEYDPHDYTLFLYH